MLLAIALRLGSAVVIYVVKIGLGMVVFAWKAWLGVLFLAAYGAYFWREIRGEDDEDEGELEPPQIDAKAA
jgi:cation:H+ antiporter